MLESAIIRNLNSEMDKIPCAFDVDTLLSQSNN